MGMGVAARRRGNGTGRNRWIWCAGREAEIVLATGRPRQAEMAVWPSNGLGQQQRSPRVDTNIENPTRRYDKVF